MRRGEFWVLRGQGPYAGKARPALVLQEEAGFPLQSIVVCLITSCEAPDNPYRVVVEPDVYNGLFKTSYIMVDKLYAAKRSEFGERIGTVGVDVMDIVAEKLRLLLGL